MNTQILTDEADLSYQAFPNNTNLDHIPGENGLPLVGRTYGLVKDFYGLCNDQYQKYGPVSRVGLIGMKTVMLLGPELNKLIYLDPDRNFSAKMGYEETLGRFYGGGLLMRDFTDHKFQRRLFQNAFKNDAMKGYTEIINPVMKTNIDSWQNIDNFHFFPNIKITLLDAAAQVFLGVSDFKGAEAKMISQTYIDIAEGMMGVFKWDTPLLPWLKHRKAMVAKRKMEKWIRDQIPVRRAGHGKDMFSIICKEKRPDTGEYFSDEDIQAHVNFLLFAAHDTTTSNLSYIMQFLGQYPEWQEKARQEALAINKPFLDYDDLEKMEVMENIHQEALRLNPSVMMMTRRTIRECEIGGQRIPANTVCIIPPQFSHLMAEYWDEPGKFDPDRWSAQRAEHKRHPFQYIGFGGGAHKCIGMHFAKLIVKTFMNQMLLSYTWETPKGYNPSMQAVPMPKQQDDLPLTLKPIR
jgi:cytochrome P450